MSANSMLQKRGTITSAKMTGTVTVTVHGRKTHPLYRKQYQVSAKFLADTGKFCDLVEGDEVVMTECRPLSKRKHFLVTEVLKRAPRVSEIVEEEGLQEAMHPTSSL